MAAKTKKKKSKTGLLIVFFVVLAVLGTVLFKVFGPNVSSHTNGDYLYIHTGSNFDQAMVSLEQGGFVSDPGFFSFIARRMGLPAHIRPGRYKITAHMSNYRIIRLLHSGKQSPVKLVINKLRTRQDLVRLISANLEPDSNTVYKLFHDPVFLAQFEVDTNTLTSIIIPDTYEFFWNTTADKALKKIARNHAKFWDDTRKEQAKQHGLTPLQATIVASIVDEETNMNEDKPRIASVYLNRIQKGMKLQADPTVKFAIGDFTIKRVTGPMLGTASPYNTYMYEGLPPGPICTPSVSSLNAVLTSPRTTYLYFCAKEDFSGYSNFASDYNEQLKNAAKYRKALDERGIH